MKFFEKIYPKNAEGELLYYEGGLYFNRSSLQTNIPRKLQRHYRIPALNPKYAEKSFSVKSYIRLFTNIDKYAIVCYFPLSSK